MSGFAGFAGFNESLWEERYLWASLGKRMVGRLTHRGCAMGETSVSNHCVLSFTGSGNFTTQSQPLKATINNEEYIIVLDGEIYNLENLKEKLQAENSVFNAEDPATVLLNAFAIYGEKTPELLQGRFSFIIENKTKRSLFLCRDHLGAKPLFYTFSGDRLVFGSEIKALFEYPGVKPLVSRQGVCQLFSAPYGAENVFTSIKEISAGSFAVFNENGFTQSSYYCIKSSPNTDSFDEAVANINALITKSIEYAASTSGNLCTVAQGGWQDILLTAYAKKILKKTGRELSSYSFHIDSQGMESPELECFENTHTEISCYSTSLYRGLFHSTIAMDLPSLNGHSMLNFLCEIGKSHKNVLAPTTDNPLFGDEQGVFEKNITPVLGLLLKPKFNFLSYVSNSFEEAKWCTPIISGESPEQIKRRHRDYLFITRHLPTRLAMADRLGMQNGVNVILPFASPILSEYLYNTPCTYRQGDKISKALLGLAKEDDFLCQLKNYNAGGYTQINSPKYILSICQKLSYILLDTTQPIHKIIDSEKAKSLLGENSHPSRPWLITLFEYLIQVNYWMIRYNVYIED